MSDRTELLMYARRLHNALRSIIDDGDGRTDEHWINVEKPIFEHYVCSMYLSGVLSYLEDKYGQRPWNLDGESYSNFNQYIENSGIKSFQLLELSSSKIEALVCIRNAVMHNGGDLSKNRDINCFDKVHSENIPNIFFDGTVIKLKSSNYQDDFMEFVRQSFLAVAMHHGDG